MYAPLTELEVVFGYSMPWQQRVAWPIIKTTTKAYLIATPGGETWVPDWRWRHVSGMDDFKRLEAALSVFRGLSSQHQDARVPVRRAGRGSSEKSIKIIFRVSQPVAPECWETRERTATVPASLLQADGQGGWTMPLWVLRKRLLENQHVVGGVWSGLAAVEQQLQDAFENAVSGEKRHNEALIQRREAVREEEARKQEALRIHRKRIIEEDAELALAFARRQLTLQDLADLGCRLVSWPRWYPGETIDPLGRWAVELECVAKAVSNHPDFAHWRDANLHRRGSLLKPPKPVAPRAPREPDEVIANCTVEFACWYGKEHFRSNYHEEGCTIRRFGKKHEIHLPDGSVVIKMAGKNLTIIPNGHVDQVAKSQEVAEHTVQSAPC